MNSQFTIEVLSCDIVIHNRQYLIFSQSSFSCFLMQFGNFELLEWIVFRFYQSHVDSRIEYHSDISESYSNGVF